MVKKGVAAIPCGVDKYNSYRKYGETSVLSKTASFGVFRAGLWYEWARTDRHQYPSDPLTHWTDQALPNFAEQFWTNSYQPFAEFEYHATPKFNITAGTKYAAYTFNVLHHADDGKEQWAKPLPTRTDHRLPDYCHGHRQLYGVASLTRLQLSRPPQLPQSTRRLRPAASSRPATSTISITRFLGDRSDILAS